MKKQKAVDEKNKGTKNKSDKIFNELAFSVINSSSTKLNDEKKTFKHSAQTLNESKASDILYATTVNKWLHKKGLKSKKTFNFHKFALDFFKQLDQGNTREIEGEALLKSLLNFGIASDPTILRRTLGLIFKTNHFSSLKINSQDFVNLFKIEPRTDKILKRLNEICIEERENKSHKFNPKVRNSVDNSEDPNNTLKTSIGLLLKKQVRKANTLITINEYLDMISVWWKSLDQRSLSVVPTEDVIKLFVTQGIASDRNDSRNLIFSQLGVKPNITFDEFQQLFAKSLLKGALLNLSKRLSEGKYSDELMSPEFQLTSYQRALMMSGIKCSNSDISVEEGLSTLLAIQKYNLQTNNNEK